MRELRHWNRLHRQGIEAASLKCSRPGWKGFEQTHLEEGVIVPSRGLGTS